MGTKKFEFSVRSVSNMAAIKRHIAEDNPQAAERVINSIFMVADELMNFPFLGRTGRRTGTRELVLPQYPYTVVYRVTRHSIHIVAVLHQSQKCV